MKITTSPDELNEGLFGQVVLWTFETLPYLEKNGFFPGWDIKSRLYGRAPDYTVLPGVFDLAYAPAGAPDKAVGLLDLRQTHASLLGGDWQYLHRLWHTYFLIPDRINTEADRIALPSGSLGLHYRGNDKRHSPFDTNPVSQEDFLTLTRAFLRDRPDVGSLFIATDEYSFVQKARRYFPGMDVINLGEVGFHKACDGVEDKADRALVDCVLLSRCRYVLKCCSALSAFAKVINPGLESYRVSACRLFTDVPYAPDAYVPRFTASDRECGIILEYLFAGDWLDDGYMVRRFGKPFQALPRYTAYRRLRNRVKFLVTD